MVASQSSYATRFITPTFRLRRIGKDLTFTGLRVELTAVDAMLPSTNGLIMRINGMRLQDMNDVSVAGLNWYAAAPGSPVDNFVTVVAGTDGSTAATIFTGFINEAYPDGRQPDMGFIVRASVSVGYSMPTVDVTNFKGPVTFKNVLDTLAAKAGLTVQNNGVEGSLLSPNYHGSILDQIKDATYAMGAYAKIDHTNKLLIVRPIVGGTSELPSVEFSPESGMIGYPQFENQNIIVRSIFDPSLFLPCAAPFSVKSQFTPANNSSDNPWLCRKVDYNLSSQLPGGPWEMVVEGYPKNNPPPGVSTSQ